MLNKPDDPSVVGKRLYFINEIVEDKLRRYLWTRCTAVNLRDSIMEHAGELITQIIRRQNLHVIYPGQEESAFGDLVQTAWLQIERTLYKFRSRPHCRACYNPERPGDSVLYNPASDEYGIITFDELFAWLGVKALRLPICPEQFTMTSARIASLVASMSKSNLTKARAKGRFCPKCKSKLSAGPEVEPIQGTFGGSESILYRGSSKVFNMWCVSPETLLLGGMGIQSIGDLTNSFVGSPALHRVSPPHYRVYGLGGQSRVQATLERPETDTLDVRTRLGYALRCSPEHKLWSITGLGRKPGWAEAKDLRPGDLVAIQAGQEYYLGDDSLADIVLSKRGDWSPPERLTPELAYILGLYIAEGSYSYGKLVIYNVDEDVVRTLISNTLGLNFIEEPEFQRISLCNVRFIEFLSQLGFGPNSTAASKQIPSRVLRCSREIMIAMLRGMFDGGGHSSRYNGVIGYTSTSDVLARQVRVLLLNLGILTKWTTDKRRTRKFPGGYVSNLKGAIQLVASTHYSSLFYDKVGFAIRRKQAKRRHLRRDHEIIYGLNDSFRRLHAKYGPGLLGYNSIRRLLKAKYCTIETALAKLPSWAEWQSDEDYQFVAARLVEFTRNEDKLVWLPITAIKASRSRLCEISVDSPDHSYFSEGFISHNSQVSRTVILAFVKKEARDRKNATSYRSHLAGTPRINEDRMQRFIDEAGEICKYNEGHATCLSALVKLMKEDDKPHEGLVAKLVDLSGLSRAQVSEFLTLIRMRSHEFSDSPLSREASHHERPNRLQQMQGHQEEEFD